MTKKAILIALLRFRYTASCCGEEHTWRGAAPKNARYVCRICGKRMRVTETEVRTADEAELAIRGRDFVEKCAECDSMHNHTIERHDEGLFLVCGTCGEELRELDEPEKRRIA